jgi:hypothetical protein
MYIHLWSYSKFDLYSTEGGGNEVELDTFKHNPSISLHPDRKENLRYLITYKREISGLDANVHISYPP